MALSTQTRVRLLKVGRMGAAVALMYWAYSRFRDHYTCMLPWDSYGQWLEGSASRNWEFEYVAFMFVVTSVAFFVGFVWLCAEVVAPVIHAMHPHPLEPWLAGVLVGLLLYGSVTVFTHATYPNWGRDAHTHRTPLSLSWVAGAFERADHYGSHCGA